MSFEANQYHLMSFASRGNPSPPQPQAVTRGFERIAFPKIEQELRHPDLVIQRKALIAVREFTGSSLPSHLAVQSGVHTALLERCGDSDPEMRTLACQALGDLLRTEHGCEQVMAVGGLSSLVVLLEDDESVVRDEAYAALTAASRFEKARIQMMDLRHLLPLLVRRAANENDVSRRDAALSLLHSCLLVRRNDEALRQTLEEADALAVCGTMLRQQRMDGETVLLSASTASREFVHPVSTRERAAEVVTRLTASRMDCKVRAASSKPTESNKDALDLVPALVELLRVPIMSPRIAAAAALCSLTTVQEGKEAWLAAGGNAVLVPLLSLRHPTLRIHCLTLLMNVTEHPAVRQDACEREAVPHLVAMLHAAAENDEVLRRFAAQCLRQVQFTARPFDQLPV